MKENKSSLRPKQLSFESENLEVDYITLNISIEGQIDPKPIGEFLFGHGFNCKVLEEEEGKAEKLFFSKNNKYQVILIKSSYNPEANRFWNGIKVRFPGSNAKFFYNLLKENKIKFDSFPGGGRVIRLGRFDLCYCFQFSVAELGKRSEVRKFFLNCKLKFLKKYPDQKVSIARKSLKLTAPVRKKSKRYYRIYEKFHHLRFELEMRQECFKYCGNSFFSYSFEEFEDELLKIFLAELEDLCPVDFNYSFWLLEMIRRNSSFLKLKDLSSGMSKAIVSPYNLSFSKDITYSFQCLQLISFLQREDIQKDLSFANSLNIVIVEFPIIDFLKFIGKNQRDTYCREAAKFFFANLLELEPLKIKVNDNRSVAFTFCNWVAIEKRNSKLFIELRIAASILFCIYPYTLPKTLLIYKKKSELEIKCQFIESLNIQSIWKKFEINKTYKYISLSNAAIESRHDIIIDILKELEDKKEIESKVWAYSKEKINQLIEIKNLTHKILKNNSIIFFQESVRLNG